MRLPSPPSAYPGAHASARDPPSRPPSRHRNQHRPPLRLRSCPSRRRLEQHNSNHPSQNYADLPRARPPTRLQARARFARPHPAPRTNLPLTAGNRIHHRRNILGTNRLRPSPRSRHHRRNPRPCLRAHAPPSRRPRTASLARFPPRHRRLRARDRPPGQYAPLARLRSLPQRHPASPSHRPPGQP
jgi:hypothetical protein